MKRLLVVSMLSLALAGCAQSKGALSRGASYPPSPVAITPVPSVYDTINQGMGGKALAQTAMPKPDDPQWSGRAPVPVAAQSVSTSPPGSPGGQSSTPAAGAGAPGAAAVASGPSQSPVQPGGPASAPAAPAALAVMPPTENQVPATKLAESPAMPAPAALPAPAAGVPGPASPREPRTVLSGAIVNDPGSIPLGSVSEGARPSVELPTSVAVSPPASSMPATLAGAPAPSTTAPKRNADPLLGPDPDLMPAMPALPPGEPSNKQASPPAGTSLELAPAASAEPTSNPPEPAGAGPGVMGTPSPADPPLSLDSSTAAAKPADGGLAAADLKLERAPPSTEVVRTVAARPINRSPAPAPVDKHVILTSAADSNAPAKSRTASLKEAGRAVARVGDEIITQHELVDAVKELIDRKPEIRAGLSGAATQREKTQMLDMVCRQVLDGLIDRSLLVQEAKRHIKDKKMLEKAYEEADRVFREQEIIPLQRKYNVDSEAKVKERLAEEGRSLEAMRLSFRQYFLSQGFMIQKIKDRFKVELPDLLKYYNQHVYEHDFDRPAQITWRELVIEVDKHKNRDDANKKANALLERLRRGEDFATLAQAESDGLSSSRSAGGLMHTTPGSYAVESINKALDNLPIGQLSGVLEGPGSFHILKVENRRPAGPASFEEIQDKIKPMLENSKFQEEQAAFLKKLRRDALITLYLNKTDPNKP
jgi:parvulin-like peptidyl-prolyl isomerase